MESRYANILAALDSGKDKSKLTLEQQAENYSAFSKLMEDGVYIPDLLARVKELESKPAQAVMDGGLFEVMEAAVCTDAEVSAARSGLHDLREDVLTGLCRENKAFREAEDAYRALVNRRYVEQREHRDGRTEEQAP